MDAVPPDDSPSSSVSLSSSSLSVDLPGYQMQQELSSGAIATVYLAIELNTNNLYAVKVINQQQTNTDKRQQYRVTTEQYILTHVSHPCIVPLHHIQHTQQWLCFIMEYMQGGDLAQYLHSQSVPPPLSFTVTILSEVISAVLYLHHKGIIHRDVTPHNICLDHTRQHCKLTDFSHSTWRSRHTVSDDAGADTSLLPPSVIPCSVGGTADYLAPEVILGLHHDYAVDWWAIGVLAFQLLTLRTPFHADDKQEIYDNIIERNIQWPENSSNSSGSNLIQRCLCLDPTERLGDKDIEQVMRHPFFKGVTWENIPHTNAPTTL